MCQRSKPAVSKVATIGFEGKGMAASIVTTTTQPESISASTKAHHGTCTCNYQVLCTSLLLQRIHQLYLSIVADFVMSCVVIVKANG